MAGMTEQQARDHIRSNATSIQVTTGSGQRAFLSNVQEPERSQLEEKLVKEAMGGTAPPKQLLG